MIRIQKTPLTRVGAAITLPPALAGMALFGAFFAAAILNKKLDFMGAIFFSVFVAIPTWQAVRCARVLFSKPWKEEPAPLILFFVWFTFVASVAAWSLVGVWPELLKGG